MPVSKRKPRPRTRKPGAETDYAIARDAVRYDPARYEWGMNELERMAKGESEYGQLPPALKILCIKEILNYEGVPAALRFKADANIAGDTNIQISVLPWAAGPSVARPALPAPAPEEIVIHEPNAPRTENSQPSPELSSRDRILAQARAARETAVYEVSANPSEPPREVARVSQAKGTKWPTPEEKLENKLGGRRESTP